MFLNQASYMWRDLGRVNPTRSLLLMLLPALLFVILALPAGLSQGPVADHTHLSGTGSSTSAQIHLGGSYRMTVAVVPQLGCSFDASVNGTGPRYGLGSPDFSSGIWTDRHQVTNTQVTDVQDGLYSIISATGCGPWTVTLDRA